MQPAVAAAAVRSASRSFQFSPFGDDFISGIGFPMADARDVTPDPEFLRLSYPLLKPSPLAMDFFIRIKYRGSVDSAVLVFLVPDCRIQNVPRGPRLALFSYISGVN